MTPILGAPPTLGIFERAAQVVYRPQSRRPVTWRQLALALSEAPSLDL